MAALEREPADQGAFLDQACFQDGAVKLSSGEVTLAADSICQACDCSDAYLLSRTKPSYGKLPSPAVPVKL